MIPVDLTDLLLTGAIALNLWVLQQVYSMNGRVSRIEGHLGVKKRG